ncbi:hypothetical protein Leryth_019710 [Lithospermum erythrorhizon]|nr:hypothetical protein Leryth_019710 [Lithospermum erythrorhizon]
MCVDRVEVIPFFGFCDLMGENREETKRTDTSKMENLSLEPNRFSRDLLQRFMGSGSSSSSSSSSSSLRQKEFLKREVEEEEEGEGDLELSLGLSLGGRFGVDKSKLVRSSSIAACLPIVRDDDAVAPPATVYPALVRTSSLPVETEEEWRKRKEMQSLRRMEAKRRRSEKQRNVRVEREGGSGGGGGGGGESSGGAFEEEKKETIGKDPGDTRVSRTEVNWRTRLELYAAKTFGPSSCGLNNAVSSVSRQGSIGSGIDLGIGKGKISHVGRRLLSQGSIESQGGSQSSISPLESNALPGTSSGSDLSPASIQSLQERTNQDASSSGLRTRGDTSRPSRVDSGKIPRGTNSRKRGKEPGKNDMPCVFTKGDGPNGRRVDGILYKYGKGEEVRIMCVCHGNFLSPAEFVTHAGGSDVTHPLKHIVINPNPPSF